MEEAEKVEHAELAQLMRFFLDYRLKLLAFYVTFNAGMFTLTLKVSDGSEGSVLLAVFGLAVAAIGGLLEARINRIIYCFRKALLAFESECGLRRLHSARKANAVSLLSFRALFASLHLMIVLCWVGLIVRGLDFGR